MFALFHLLLQFQQSVPLELAFNLIQRVGVAPVVDVPGGDPLPISSGQFAVNSRRELLIGNVTLRRIDENGECSISHEHLGNLDETAAITTGTGEDILIFNRKDQEFVRVTQNYKLVTIIRIPQIKDLFSLFVGPLDGDIYATGEWIEEELQAFFLIKIDMRTLVITRLLFIENPAIFLFQIADHDSRGSIFCMDSRGILRCFSSTGILVREVIIPVDEAHQLGSMRVILDRYLLLERWEQNHGTISRHFEIYDFNGHMAGPVITFPSWSTLLTTDRQRHLYLDNRDPNLSRHAFRSFSGIVDIYELRDEFIQRLK